MTRSAYHGYDTDVFGGIPPLTVRHSMPNVQAWRSRIVGHADVEPSSLLAHEKNFRRHPKNQQAVLQGLIGEIGFTSPVLVQAGSDRVIDGHLRVELALRDNQSTIPVTYLDLTDAEADLALATTDPVSAMAYADAAQLDALLREVSTSDAAVMQMLSDLAADNGVVPEFDAMEHWQGMPEFDNEGTAPVKQLTVNFASVDDIEGLSRFLGQTITLETKSIWFPERQLESIKDSAYVNAAD